MKIPFTAKTPYRHRAASTAALCLFGLIVLAATAAPQRKKQRPKTDERVFLIHSDELKYDRYSDRPDAQIVKGKVHFSHAGAQLWCDSAYFFQDANSVEAFGHVRFKQGDTLSLTCDRADYDGGAQMMHARHNVVLRHRQQTLYTDSLDYDRIYSNAYFFEGGKLIDGKDRLVSDWGEYNTVTRQASFFYNVQMQSDKNHVSTDTLHYDTRTSVAHVTGPSKITSKGSVIRTSDAYLDSRTDRSRMFGRSTIVDKEKTITGDSLYHDNRTGHNEGYGNVVYVDTLNKNALACGHLIYDETTGYGFATRRAVMRDFSQKDTLYMHADTMKIYTFNINTDSVYRKVHAFRKVRAFRTDVQAVCDSMVFNSKDSCMTMYHDPIVWNGQRQLLGEVIKVYMNDSTVRRAEIIGQALSVERLDNRDHYNQVSSKRMDAFFTDGVLRQTEASGNVISVYYNVEGSDSTLSEHNYLETDTMRMYLSAERQLEKIWTSKATGTLSPMTQIPADKLKLKAFAWFDYIRPVDKDDIFLWRGKGKDGELKKLQRREAPLPSFGNGL